MSDAKKRVVVTLTADAKQFQRQMDMIARDMAKVGKQLQSAGRAMTMSITAPLAALGTISVISYDKQVKAIAQIEAGLKSTGNAAGFTSEELQKMASDLQKKTLFGDEEILQKATAQLLTFTTIAKGEFERAQVAAMNLATRLDGDLQAASIMVGKALNDPIRGLTAMGRAGVQFTQDQKDVIKSLWEAGKQAEAQQMILAELEKQYGGSAEAAAKAGLGGFTQMKNALGDLSEEFGKIIVDAINPLVAKVQGLVARFQAFDDQKKKNIVRFAAIAAAIGPVLYLAGMLAVQFSKVVKIFTAFRVLSMSMISGINLTTAGVTTQVFGVQALSAAWSKLTLAMKTNVIMLGITALIAGIMALNKLFSKRNELQETFTEIEKRHNDSLVQEQTNVSLLFSALKKTNEGTQERKKLIDEINSKYPEKLKNYKTEAEFLKNIALAEKEIGNEIVNNIALEIQREKITELQKKKNQLLHDHDRLLAKLIVNQRKANDNPYYDQKAQARMEFAERDLKAIEKEMAALNSEMEKVKSSAASLALSLRTVTTSDGGGGGGGGKDVKTYIEKLTDNISKLEAELKNLIATGGETGTVLSNLLGKKEELRQIEAAFDIMINGLGKIDKLQVDIDIDTDQVTEAVELVNHLGDAIVANAEKWNSEMDQMNRMLESFVEQGIANMAQFIGEAFVTKDWDEAMNSMILMLANFAEQFGQYLIALGVAEEAFKASLASGNGIPAIAAGVALIGAAAAIKMLMAKKADEFALGTNFAPGGMALVGERGPELVHLPRGSRVIPNMQTEGMLSTGNLFVTLKGSDIQIALDRNAKRQRRYS